MNAALMREASEIAQQERCWVIYCEINQLFWHNGEQPENEEFAGWGHPITASRYTEEETHSYEYIAGTQSRWVRLDDPIILNWNDPDGD